VSAVILSALRIRFQGTGAPTQRQVREAILESTKTLISDPRFVVEPDESDPNVMKVRLVWKAAGHAVQAVH
jgi:hypothetical protein